MLGVPSTALQRLFSNWGTVHSKVMSQCVTRTEQNHPWNQPTNPPRGIHRAFQTRGPGKTGQMPSASQIYKLYRVHSLFKNFKSEQAYPVRVRWLPADLKYQKPEQKTKQRYTYICTGYIHSGDFFLRGKQLKACHMMKTVLNYHLKAIWDPIFSTEQAAPPLPSAGECSSRVQLSELCRGQTFGWRIPY